MITELNDLMDDPTENQQNENGESRVDRLKVIYNNGLIFDSIIYSIGDDLQIPSGNEDETAAKRYASIPHILTRAYKKFGIDYLADSFNIDKSNVHVFDFQIDGLGWKNRISKKRNLKTKRAFEETLSPMITDSKEYKKITNDYDILAPNNDMQDEEFRRQYQEIGRMNRIALQRAIDSGSDVEICMRVIEKDGSPYAVNTARILLDLGATVYNYDEGQKFGSIRYRDIGTERKAVYTIHRDWFTKYPSKRAETMQYHKGFTAIVLDNCESAYEAISQHIDKVKGTPLTKEDLAEF